MKAIIESGELKDPGLIRSATEICIEAGADFIKTSTGKVSVNATLDASRVILETIRAFDPRIGHKVAGGIQTVNQAVRYIQLAREVMGEKYISSKTFRIGASSLRKQLC